ncbi:hypothetical protein BHE74_00023985 [Ensete ventricosum]|nr:hypothetical protein BHE74_00023985 [Ensete ventricosum]RZS23935.1 hypothetical protein BHM03_00056946 [Ensete ventricosum]
MVLPKWLEGGLRGPPRSRESSMDQQKNTMGNNQDDASPTELSKSGTDAGGWGIVDTVIPDAHGWVWWRHSHMGLWTPSYQMCTAGFGGAAPTHDHITHGCS